MKGNYTKPLLAVEMFSLTQSTARDCTDGVFTDKLTLNDPYSCGLDMGGGLIFFMESGSVCNRNGEGSFGMCYNNPGEGNYIFRS